MHKRAYICSTFMKQTRIILRTDDTTKKKWIAKAKKAKMTLSDYIRKKVDNQDPHLFI